MRMMQPLEMRNAPTVALRRNLTISTIAHPTRRYQNLGHSPWAKAGPTPRKLAIEHFWKPLASALLPDRNSRKCTWTKSVLPEEFVYDSAIYYVTAVVDSLEEQDIHHALMLRRHGGTWAHWPIEARIVSHCVCPGPMIFSLSEEGRIEVAHGPSRRWESLASLRTQPGLGNLTAVRQVGEFVYVVGMQRQVYRRPVNARR